MTNIMAGYEFKLKYPNTKFYKLTNESECHNNFQFKDGLNVDTIKFNPLGECYPGGLYFTELNKISCWISYIDIMYIREVEIIDDSVVKIEQNKFKTDKFILKNKQLISDFEYWNDLEFCKLYVKQNGMALRYVRNKTDELYKEAVKQNGMALRYVLKQTDEICLLAVKNFGGALKYVLVQTDEICKEAVKNYGMALKYVQLQTDEICKEAVKNIGYVLEYVLVQTEEICLIAVKSNGLSLKYVLVQTDEICKETVKSNIFALRYVQNNKVQNYISTLDHKI